MPFCPKVIEKIGPQKTLYLALALQILGCLMMFFGPYTNVPYMLIAHAVYGGGYIGGPCGFIMLAHAISSINRREHIRPDGTAYALNGLANKVGQAVGSALCIAIIGWFGYVGGKVVTPHIAVGIQLAVNIVPAAVYAIAFIPVFLFRMEKDDMQEEGSLEAVEN